MPCIYTTARPIHSVAMARLDRVKILASSPLYRLSVSILSTRLDPVYPEAFSRPYFVTSEGEYGNGTIWTADRSICKDRAQWSATA